jgi:hypothetical protein
MLALLDSKMGASTSQIGRHRRETDVTIWKVLVIDGILLHVLNSSIEIVKYLYMVTGNEMRQNGEEGARGDDAHDQNGKNARNPDIYSDSPP